MTHLLGSWRTLTCHCKSWIYLSWHERNWNIARRTKRQLITLKTMQKIIKFLSSYYNCKKTGDMCEIYTLEDALFQVKMIPLGTMLQWYRKFSSMKKELLQIEVRNLLRRDQAPKKAAVYFWTLIIYEPLNSLSLPVLSWLVQLAYS